MKSVRRISVPAARFHVNTVSVLMGYGFCLDPNEADSFNLSYSPALSQHIEAAKARRKNVSGLGDQKQMPIGNSTMPSSAETTNADGNQSATTSIIGETPVKDVKFVSLGGSDYQFCPGFLADCSLALQNSRERKQNPACIPSITKFSNDTLSRNKLHTLSSIIMILQQKQTEIHQHDTSIPPTPRNQNQRYASIYRSSQLKILEGVLGSLSSTLKSIMQLKLAEQPRIIRLVDILKKSPKVLRPHFREVVHVGLRTRDAQKVVERRGVKFAFTIWLCGLRLLHRRGQLRNTDPALGEWMDFLCKHYDDRTIHECLTDKPKEAEEAQDSQMSKADEVAETVRSYDRAIQMAVKRHPESIYDDEWARDQSNLVWCFVVIREESVRCPTVTDGVVLGEDEDEFVLVIDGDEAELVRTENHNGETEKSTGGFE